MSISKITLGVLINTSVFAVLLFVPAGTLHWWRAWAFLGVNLIYAAVSTVTLYRINTGVLEERFKPPLQKGQPWTDKIVVLALLIAFGLVVAFIPVDVFRLHLLPKPAIAISLLGIALFIFGWGMMILALRENAFATLAVRHLTERHQIVIDTGVYGIVRHPMYAGFLPLLVGMSLWLESYAAALLSVAPFVVLVVRILIEEKFLRRELPGYDTYTQRVRYRLIPFVW
jgi:protein-S-isoprenylcysteine O-methyltransferase Ste14